MDRNEGLVCRDSLAKRRTAVGIENFVPEFQQFSRSCRHRLPSFLFAQSVSGRVWQLVPWSTLRLPVPFRWPGPAAVFQLRNFACRSTCGLRLLPRRSCSPAVPRLGPAPWASLRLQRVALLVRPPAFFAPAETPAWSCSVCSSLRRRSQTGRAEPVFQRLLWRKLATRRNVMGKAVQAPFCLSSPPRAKRGGGGPRSGGGGHFAGRGVVKCTRWPRKFPRRQAATNVQRTHPCQCRIFVSSKPPDPAQGPPCMFGNCRLSACC